MRRLAALVLSAAVGFGGVVLPAGAAGAAEGDDTDGTSEVTVTRYGGADRYATSLRIAEAFAADAGDSLDWVVLVSGRRWTDAVVAAPVAGSLSAPVLMTPPDDLRADALEFLQRVGISNALVVGPDASGGGHGPGQGVGVEVLEALDEAGIAAERIAGDDRYGTGVVAAGRVSAGVMPGLGRTAIVASGEVFADALVAGPFAAHGSHPVLLTPPDELHADVAGYLDDAGISHVVLMGGTAALSEPVETAISSLGVKVTRVAGATRYDTAVKAAELVTDLYSDTAGQRCFATSTIGLARARVPFDSFSAAPLLGRLCAPLVLADPDQVPDDTAAYLDAAREAHPTVGLRVFGGDAAVSQTAITAYLTGEEAAEDPEAEGDEAEGDEVEDPEADETADEDADTETDILPAGTCGGAIDDEPTQLVPSTNAEDPAWSPDCSKLVYTDRGSLWTVNNDGSNRTLLVPHDGSYRYSAAWSPLGDRIAYSAGQNDGNGNWMAHIWTVNVDGSHNNQRTEGDVVDQWSTWSPDGKRIAFERLTGSDRDDDGHRLDGDRHIVVMTSYGNDPKALNEGGHWEQSPAWSPGGSRLAYQVNGDLVVSDIDGDNARRVLAAVYFNGGLSWSPDGTRIAFVRGDGIETSVVISDIDGLDEEVVFDEGLRTLAPRWSPDGQRIAFHTIDNEGEHRSYVAGASGEAVPSQAAECRPRGLSSGTTAGFPLPDRAASPVGTLRLALLFMDFPDAQAAHTTQEEAQAALLHMEEYLETMSYGLFDLEVVPHHGWLRAEHPYEEYLIETAADLGLDSELGEHAVALADGDVDFSDIDAVMTVFPSTHFGGGLAGGHITADGVTVPQSRVNTFPHDEPRELSDWSTWGDVAAHELVHNLGPLDLYPYDLSRHERPAAPDGSEWVSVEMGLMGLSAWYLADASLMVTRLTIHRPDGSRQWVTFPALNPREMLAWLRWQLGWLSEDQVYCGDRSDTTVTLSPIARPGDGTAMAAIPLNRREVIVVESRRQLGYDFELPYYWSDGTSSNRPALLTEGVLVYVVDALVGSGDLPMTVAGDSGNGQVDDFPVLAVGESVTVRGYTITVTADDGATHSVSITRDT